MRRALTVTARTRARSWCYNLLLPVLLLMPWLSSGASSSFLGNPGVEGDARGRIPLWGEETADALLPGRRAGKLVLETAVKRSGTNSVRLTCEGDWFALASVNYPLPGWTDRFELSGWVRTETNASAQLLACWTDDSQNVLRVDAGASLSGKDWLRAVLSPPPPPSNAMNVRLVAVSRGGVAWFDDFDWLRLPPQRRLVQVWVNQVGYESDGPKSAVVAANFRPASGEFDIRLLGSKGKVEWNKSVGHSRRIHEGAPDDWGWYFWRTDFSEVRNAGHYALVATAEGTRGESPAIEIGRELLLTKTASKAVDFFFIQRCGFAVPGWHKACHLDDANLPDGTHIDATGGWHSAGDYNKLMYENGDGGVVYALLQAYAKAPQIFDRQDRDGDGRCDALDEAQWGAQFVARMQVPQTGGLRFHIHQGPGRNWTKWSAPEDHTDNVVGTADDPVIQPGEGNSPLVIGAWARLAGLAKRRGATNDFLEPALRLWKHATQDGKQLGSPHLLLSALELHQATRQDTYRDYAERAAETLLSRQTTNGPQQGAFGDYGELTAGALASYALANPGGRLTSSIKRALSEYITFCVRNADNPFGLCTRSANPTNGFFPPDLGHNFQLLQRAWAAALAYRLTDDERARRFAADQIDWVLGKNPIGLCMFEGQGTRNPPRYHHRYNVIAGRERGAVPGTIPNGFVREMGLADRPGFDLSRAGGRSPSYRTSEPWLVHNMWYLLALSEF